ncbi:unnamed protein product [Rotaria sp. Silwood1]|nr:unnamed protein product [Rotaria sp. Silwood1]
MKSTLSAMIETCDTTDSDTIVMVVTRFGTSDKLVHLTQQQQLDLIPYLSVLVAHKNDFSSIENENGEYVLSHSIEYTWFTPIFHSITSKKPYTLLEKLSEDNNALVALQLFDYLDINSFPLPLLNNARMHAFKSKTDRK